MTDIERCDREIAEEEAMLRAGHCDVAGLLLKFMDWSIERRILSGSAAIQLSGEKLDKCEVMWA